MVSLYLGRGRRLNDPRNQTNFCDQTTNKKGIVYRKIHRGSFVNDPYKRKHDHCRGDS